MKYAPTAIRVSITAFFACLLASSAPAANFVTGTPTAPHRVSAKHRLARDSGLKNLPDITLGADAVLQGPISKRIENTTPADSPGGMFPDLPPTRDFVGQSRGNDTGCLVYLRWRFTDEARPRFEAGKRYAFMAGFEAPAHERGFPLANANAAGINAPPSLSDAHDHYHGGWGLRREGEGTLPPTMVPGTAPPDDAAQLTLLHREALFAKDAYRFQLTPNTDGFPDVDTYRDLEFYFEIASEVPLPKLPPDRRSGSQHRIVFPSDPSVLDVKRDFGAKGDGVTDDTAALQVGIEASSNRGRSGGTKILFLPDGTYRVSSNLVVKARVGPWVYGESRDGVVIRLADGVATNVTAVLRTHPSDTKASSADFFMRNFRHLTIDVGHNPHADAIRWYGNNSSILKDVRVTGTGRAGINAGFLGQNGPNLIQDAVVEGSFETGVRCAWSWGQTLSRVTVRNPCAPRIPRLNRPTTTTPGARRIGRCLPAPSATPTATIPSGRCMRRRANRSSTPSSPGALSGIAWTELTQAKWNLRRMLAHHGKDYPFSLFTLMELHYPGRVNTKGLLKSNPDKTVAYAKPAYLAAQNVFAVFDDSLSPLPDLSFTMSVTNRIALDAYRQREAGRPVVALWCKAHPPTEANTTTPVDLSLGGLKFTEPVYADLLTGKVYAIPPERWSADGDGVSFQQIPIYDSPILIAEKSLLPLAPDTVRSNQQARP